MTDQGTQFDDEFLSAYLDDELAPEDRARVEERLAADSDARKLLDELRAVSQATKELPPEKLEGEIRDVILRRAERAMLLSPAGERASVGGGSVVGRGVTSRISIGRSPRGWMWAGLAVAAALMLMVYQTEPEQNDKLPAAVAARSDESRESTAEPADRLELRALSREATAVEDVAAPLAEAETAPPATPPSAGYEFGASRPVPAVAQPAGDLDKRLAEMRDDAPAAAGGAVVRSKSAARSTAMAPASGRESGIDRAGGVGGAVVERSLAESVAVETDADEAGWLVVHLQCKPEALERKVFDQALLKNNITIEEPETTQDELRERSVRSNLDTSSGARFQLQRSKERATEPSIEEHQSFDAVLVEVETAQFKRVMEDIEADDENFPGIAVEEQPAEAKKAAAMEQNGDDWQQFSRGQVLQQGKLERRAGNYFYYQSDRGPIALGRTADDEAMAPQQQTLGSELAGGLQHSRAQRLQWFGEAELQLEAAEPAGPGDKEYASELSTGDTKWGLARRGVATWPKAKANLLQVLFVLQADDGAATSTAAEQTRVLQKEDR